MLFSVGSSVLLQSEDDQQMHCCVPAPAGFLGVSASFALSSSLGAESAQGGLSYLLEAHFYLHFTK